jgi:chitinase
MRYLFNCLIKFSFIMVSFLVIPNVQADSLWNKNTVYTSGERVEYSHGIYQARWWTRGNIPGVDPEWKFIECNYVSSTHACEGDDPTSPDLTDQNSTDPSVTTWQTGNVYLGGDQVIYAASIFEAKWWTKGDKPNQMDPTGPWTLIKECIQVAGTCDQGGESTDPTGPAA